MKKHNNKNIVIDKLNNRLRVKDEDKIVRN